jgi:hypothetical protein
LPRFFDASAGRTTQKLPFRKTPPAGLWMRHLEGAVIKKNVLWDSPDFSMGFSIINHPAIAGWWFEYHLNTTYCFLVSCFLCFFLSLVLFSHCRKTKQKLSMVAKQ